MREITDLARIRQKTIEMLYECELDYDEVLDLLFNDFIADRYIRLKDGEFRDLLKIEGYMEWAKETEERINDSDISTIFHVIIREPRVFNWVLLVKDYMSLEDFSYYYALAWQMVEHPGINNDLSYLLGLFRSADPKVMMDEEEYEVWSNLPDEVILYRGIAKSGNRQGLSWTLSKEKARWFKERYEKTRERGILLMAKVPKKYCVCFFNRRNEEEIILDTTVRNVMKRIEEIE